MDTFQPAPLTIRPFEVLRYLGSAQTVPSPELLSQLDRAAQTLLAAVTPRLLWRSFPLEETTLIGTTLTLPGESIRSHLESCHHCILLAATLGMEAEQLIRRAQATDLSFAVLLDSCASAALESLCDQAEEHLRSQTEARGLFLTGRYSPGYGDLPLSLQEEFCALLDTERRLGLTVSTTSLLLPRKSVTAILGISPTPPQPPKPGCTGCSLYHSCQIRLSGNICHNQKGVHT